MDQEKTLRGATSWQQRIKPTTERLGAVADNYLKLNERTFRKNSEIVDAWEQIVPRQLHEHSRLSKISGGCVYIEVETGAYMHEMQLISTELLENIKARCPYSTIKKIKVCPMRQTDSQEDNDNDRP